MSHQNVNMDNGIFANARGFVMVNPVLSETRIDTQVNVNNYPRDVPLSPVRNTVSCTSQNFVGQEVYLEKLHEHFQSNTNGRKKFLLYGMGGIGKTQICLKYIEETNSFSHIFWIDSTSENTVFQSLKDVYKQISPPDTPASSFSLDAVLNRVSALESRWLMIYDNADDSPEFLEKYLPPGNTGNILITSRNAALRKISGHENSKEVTEMDETSSVKLLLKASGLDKNDQNNIKNAAHVVKDLLHCLPLAIDMAGSYITYSQCNIDDFIKIYDKHSPKILQSSKFQGTSNYHKSVYKTFEISFEKMLHMSKDNNNSDTMQAAKHAIILMNIFAFFHNENISQMIFEQAAKHYNEHKKRYTNDDLPSFIPTMDITSLLVMDDNMMWDDWLFQESIQVLLSFSLIKKTTRDLVYTVHPLIQKYCQDRLPVTEKPSWILNTQGIIICSTTEVNTPQEYIYRSNLLPHVLQNLNHDKDLQISMSYNDICNGIADILYYNGRYDLEGKYRLKAVQFSFKQLIGLLDSFKSTMILLNNKCAESSKGQQSNICSEWNTVLNNIKMLTALYWNHEQLDFYDWLKNGMLNIQNTIPENEHFKAPLHLSNISIMESHSNDIATAKPFEDQLRHIHIQIFNNKLESTIDKVAMLSCSLGNLKRFAESEVLEKNILGIRDRTLGHEHPKTLYTMARLAYIYGKLRKFKEAETLQHKVIDIQKRDLGLEHPNTIKTMANLGNTLYKMGKFFEAGQLQSHVLDLHRNVLGDDHPDTLVVMAHLAATYKRMKKIVEAEQYQSNALSILKRILGAEHPRTLATMANQADTLKKLGRLSEAELLQKNILNTHKRILGLEHPKTVVAMNSLVDTLRKLENITEVGQLQAQILAIHNKMLGPEHPTTVDAMVNLADTYVKLGEFTNAKSLQADIVDIKKRSFGDDCHEILGDMVRLAVTLGKMGKYTEAEQLQSEVLKIRKEDLGHDDPKTLQTMTVLAFTLKDSGKFAEAEQLQTEVVEICRSKFGEEHSKTRNAKKTLAKFTNPY